MRRPVFSIQKSLNVVCKWTLPGGMLWLCSLMLSAQSLTDTQATRKTQNLYLNLHQIADTHFLFGHQDDMAYGVGWKRIKDRSDVKDLTGSFPAVHGWDLGHRNQGKSLDGVAVDDIRKWMKQVYKRRGVNTLSLHWDNFSSGGNAWDTTVAVKHILPGGKDHRAYLDELDDLAAFIRSVKVGFTQVPMIIRPFHEHNGDWFWWGRASCTEADYIRLWRFTVDYLRHEKALHNLIFAFSPDASRMDADHLERDYWYGYPGDDYVDMLAIDDYWNVGRTLNPRSPEDQKRVFVKTLEMVSRLAAAHHKVAALTETGQESVVNAHWFTEQLLEPMGRSDSVHIAYLLVWRNANTTHHYAPYPGHPAAADFLEFCGNERVLMENDLKGMYKHPHSLDYNNE